MKYDGSFKDEGEERNDEGKKGEKREARFKDLQCHGAHDVASLYSRKMPNSSTADQWSQKQTSVVHVAAERRKGENSSQHAEAAC
jgi:hypothetical protein